MRYARAIVVFFMLWGGRVWAQELTAEEIVTRMMEKNSERQAMLQRYTTDRTYRLEYSGVGGDHHAEMIVHAEYTAPGRKRLVIVAQTGSKVLNREVLRKLVEAEEETAAKQDWQRAMFSPESYRLSLVGSETLDEGPAWKIEVEPKVPGKVTYRGTIWVSKEDFATIRVVAEPARNPSWMLDRASFDAHYLRRGEVWLPATNVSTSHVRLGGEAKVTIDYGSYPLVATVPLPAVGASIKTRSSPEPRTSSLGRSLR
jgi:hypothetical protein